jgi:hypothetical protein
MLLAAAVPGWAQEAATIPASSGVYDRLESVSAYYPVRGLFLGERALSRREVERLVARLAAAIDSSADTSSRRRWARAELDEVSASLRSTRGRTHGRFGTAGAHWRADLFSSQVPSTRIVNNGLGQIDAVSHPYAPGRYGAVTVQGTVATVMPSFVAGARAWAAAVQPSASLTSIREGGWTSDRLLRRGYVRGVYRNAAVQIGLEELRWGQSPRGAMFISGNASPFPGIMLSTDSAVTLPWLFRLAGPFRMVGLLADLGGTQDPPHARLAGWQASIQPWTRFELAVAVLAHTGGDGAPKATFLERFVDLFPVIDALAPQHADLQISNKLAGGNLRLRMPELSGLDFYYELQIDDFDARRLRGSFVDDAGHLLGLRLPVAVGTRQLISRLEWHRTSLRLYEHAQFRSGVTYRERLIGNPLGPHAAGGFGSVEWRWSPLNAITLQAADERRDPAQYTVTVSGDRDRGFTFVRVSDDPDFRRRRVAATIAQTLPVGALQFTIGHSREWRTGQAGRGDWAGLLSLSSLRLPTF